MLKQNRFFKIQLIFFLGLLTLNTVYQPKDMILWSLYLMPCQSEIEIINYLFELWNDLYLTYIFKLFG